jgi:hypothetical protein
MHDQTIAITRPIAATPKPEHRFHSEEVDLPSRGHFYDSKNPLSAGKVRLKMMTAREEDILTNENLIKKGEVLNKLLDALILTENVNSDDLLIGDKNALFVAARRLAYGDEYGPIKINCPKCRQENETTINLATIREREFNFSDLIKGQNVFSFMLPFSKVTVQYKILTTADEKAIDAELKALLKINKSASTEVTTRLKYIIVSVNGDTATTTIRKFVDNELVSRDSIALRNNIKKNSPDLDMAFDFACEHCTHSERMDVPMQAQFFWPDA